MDVVIVGAHGKIARVLAGLLIARGDQVRGVIRDPDQVDDLAALGIAPVIVDLEASGAESELTQVSRGADAMVFAAGAGFGSTAERKWSVDFGGAVYSAAAASRAELDRFVLLSSMGTDQPPTDDDIHSVYLRAKARAESHIRASGLNYTIVRPGELTNDPPTGKARSGRNLDAATIPRADVAQVLLDVLDNESIIGRTFEITGGETRIKYAVSSVVDRGDTLD
jgi:uncharacterized protein YbjT (DUF2867 family)